MDHRLITIPISHYCEKARWALDRAGIAYEERRHVQLVHRFATRRAGGGTTAPVLVCPDRVLGESAAIVAYADARMPAERRLYPADANEAAEIARIESGFDEHLGPAARLWMYHQLHDRRDIAIAYNCAGVPAWERRAFPMAYPFAIRLIDRHLGVTPESASAAESIVDAAFDEVGELLADGRPYLMGERFTAADLTFSALAAAVLMPPGYGVVLPQPDELPAPMAARVRTWRTHPAGAHALRMFAAERQAERLAENVST